MLNFPYRKYSDEELFQEYQKLRDYQPERRIRRKNIGYKCSNAFFQYERMNTPSGRRVSNIEFWKNNKNFILNYHSKSTKDMDIFGDIQFLNHGPAQFPPNIAIDLYAIFKAQKILDPFSGWGDRCIAAMAKDLDYIGVDSNSNLKWPYKEMVKFYPHQSKIRFINKPVEKVDLSKLNYDFVLTSPPFWDEKQYITEKYTGMTYPEYEEFMDKVLIPTILKCVKKAEWSCYYIPKHMARYISQKTGLKWDKRLSYTYGGNKKYQIFSVYCLKRIY
jgi:ribosomal protein L34/ubiquinone/menaquinone biosynthesis C-methylase UbiE